MKTFTSLALGISTLVAASAFAAPPAPAVPTGACAGILKKSTLQTFTASETQALSGNYMGTPVVSMYLDFDNGFAYLSGIGETAAEASGDEDFTSVEAFTVADGGVITASISTTYTYAIEVIIDFVDNEGEADQFNALLIPSNGGTTFFVHGLDNTFSGVCQQI
jgi:hypothetical protein